MNAFGASPFALLDAHGFLHIVTDVVHEDDALCLALACRAMRDALGARFPACPRAGGRAVARLAARVTADGALDLGYYSDDPSDIMGYNIRGDDALRALPEGFGRLAYLPGRGLRTLDLSHNRELTALPAGLCALVGLEELNLAYCGLRALPEAVGGLTGLRKLDLSLNPGLTALPASLCALVGLEELQLFECDLTTLPEGVGGLAGLRMLSLDFNIGLTALPAGLGLLAGLRNFSIGDCPGLASLNDLLWREGLPALLAHLAAQGGEPAVGEAD
jgi:hypothetical protein